MSYLNMKKKLDSSTSVANKFQSGALLPLSLLRITYLAY